MPSTLFAKKPLSLLLEETDRVRFGLRRVLGPSQLAFFTLGTIVGGGIFVVIGEAAARHAGPAVIVSLAIAGIVSLLSALCYVELAAMTPVSGSAYTYTYASLGELPGFTVGWILVLEYIAAMATLSIGWSGYFVSLMSRLSIEFPYHLTASPTNLVGTDAAQAHGTINLPAALVVLVISIFLVIGIRESASGNAFISLLKFLVILGVILTGVFYLNKLNWFPFVPANTGSFGDMGLSGIMVAAGLLVFVYFGADAVATTTEEVRNPQRDIPTALVSGVVITILLYVLLSAIVIGTVKYTQLNVPNSLTGFINEVAGLQSLAIILEAGIIISLSSMLLILSFGASRILFAIARDGLLPRPLSRIHPRFRTPHVAAIVSSLLTAILAGLLPFGTAVRLVSLCLLITFAVPCAGVLILRRTAPDYERPFKVPLALLVAPLGLFSCIGLLVSLLLDDWVSGLILLVCVGFGIGVYAFYGYKRSHLRRATLNSL